MTPASPAEPLLRIDYPAALAKLAWSQMQGAWQLPAELTRLAVAAGARSVDFQVRGSRITMSAPGAVLPRKAIADFATLLDRELDPAERHRALVELEGRDAFVLSAIACSPVRAVSLATGGRGDHGDGRGDHGGGRGMPRPYGEGGASPAGMRLSFRAGKELAVVNPKESALCEPDVGLVVEGLPVEPERALRWLRRMARFAPIPVNVGGKPIRPGFDDPLIACQLTVPGPDGALRVHLAVPRRGEAPRLWLLRHGVIATRATVPGYPAFEAAVEMAPVSSPATPAAGLRGRLTAGLEPIVDAAVRLTIRLAERGCELPEAVRARAARLLLQAARRHLALAEIRRVDLFPVIAADRRRLVSIDEIGRRARLDDGGNRTVDAIGPDQDPRALALAGRPVLVLDQAERALLGELLEVAFSAPPPRPRPPWRRRLRDAVERLADPSRLRPARRLGDADLDPDERRLLDRLRTVVPPASAGRPRAVAFCRGRGRVRRTAEVLLLPRDNPDVRAAVRAIERDPAWLYPASLVLLGGRELPEPEIRRHWSRAFVA